MGSNGCFVQEECHFLEALWGETTSVKFRALRSKKSKQCEERSHKSVPIPSPHRFQLLPIGSILLLGLNYVFSSELYFLMTWFSLLMFCQLKIHNKPWYLILFNFYTKFSPSKIISLFCTIQFTNKIYYNLIQFQWNKKNIYIEMFSHLIQWSYVDMVFLLPTD